MGSGHHMESFSLPGRVISAPRYPLVGSGPSWAWPSLMAQQDLSNGGAGAVKVGQSRHAMDDSREPWKEEGPDESATREKQGCVSVGRRHQQVSLAEDTSSWA